MTHRPTPCPTCQNGRTRETTGMVCQTCGRDYGAPAYQPPVDIVGFGQPLPERRTPTTYRRQLHAMELAGYSLLAGVHDGEPFITAPGATKEEALAALQQIVDALEALQ